MLEVESAHNRLIRHQAMPLEECSDPELWMQLHHWGETDSDEMWFADEVAWQSILLWCLLNWPVHCGVGCHCGIVVLFTTIFGWCISLSIWVLLNGCSDVVLRKSRWTTSNVFASFQRQLVCWNGVVCSRGRIHLNSFVVSTATISNECWLNGFEHASMTMDVSKFLEYNLEEFGHWSLAVVYNDTPDNLASFSMWCIDFFWSCWIERYPSTIQQFVECGGENLWVHATVNTAPGNVSNSQ